MTNSAADVFISYKSEDRARLAPLVAALESAGFSIWWDARIGGGANWRREIEEHLDAARCVIVAWSKRSVGPAGHFVRDEATRALRRGTYLPIQIDAVSPPLGFGEVQSIDLTKWKGKGSGDGLTTLLDAVQARVDGQSTEARRTTIDRPRLSRRTIVAGGIGAAAVATGGGWLLRGPGSQDAKRIAVLPFANLSTDPEQGYFSDGITEELRSALSRIGMEVIGRASAAAVKDLDMRQAAAKLRVAHLLTGSVRRSPSIIRITAQLVDGREGVERWAQSYDRAPGDAIKIQIDIAANVAEALSIALGQAGRAALILGGTADSLAQDLVFRARERRVTAGEAAEFAQALTLVDRAIARDRNYADAFVERAMVLTTTAENFPTEAALVTRQLAEAEASAERAADIAPRLGAAHVALARIAHNRLDMSGLLRQTETALALSPDDPDVLLDASTTMAVLGRDEEAMRLSERLISIDGLNARAFARRSLVLFLRRQYAAAIDAVNRANAIAPGNPARAATAGDSWLLLGRPDRARAEYATMPADDYLRLTGEAITSAKTGNRPGAEQALARLRETYGASTSYQYAAIRAQLGDTDRAFVELGKALALKDPGLVGLRSDPFLDPIRDDPRYKKLVESLKFP